MPLERYNIHSGLRYHLVQTERHTYYKVGCAAGVAVGCAFGCAGNGAVVGLGAGAVFAPLGGNMAGSAGGMTFGSGDLIPEIGSTTGPSSGISKGVTSVFFNALPLVFSG